MHTEIALQPPQPPIHYTRLQGDPPAAKRPGQTRSVSIIKGNPPVGTLDLKPTLPTLTLSYSLSLKRCRSKQQMATIAKWGIAHPRCARAVANPTIACHWVAILVLHYPSPTTHPPHPLALAPPPAAGTRQSAKPAGQGGWLRAPNNQKMCAKWARAATLPRVARACAPAPKLVTCSSPRLVRHIFSRT